MSILSSSTEWWHKYSSCQVNIPTMNNLLMEFLFTIDEDLSWQTEIFIIAIILYKNLEYSITPYLVLQRVKVLERQPKKDGSMKLHTYSNTCPSVLLSSFFPVSSVPYLAPFLVISFHTVLPLSASVVLWNPFLGAVFTCSHQPHWFLTLVTLQSPPTQFFHSDPCNKISNKIKRGGDMAANKQFKIHKWNKLWLRIIRVDLQVEERTYL